MAEGVSNPWENSDLSEVVTCLDELSATLLCDLCGQLPTEPDEGKKANKGSKGKPLVLLIRTCLHAICGRNPSCPGFEGGNCPVSGCGLPAHAKDVIAHLDFIQRIEALNGIKKAFRLNNNNNECNKENRGVEPSEEAVEHSGHTANVFDAENIGEDDEQDKPLKTSKRKMSDRKPISVNQKKAAVSVNQEKGKKGKKPKEATSSVGVTAAVAETNEQVAKEAAEAPNDETNDDMAASKAKGQTDGQQGKRKAEAAKTDEENGAVGFDTDEDSEPISPPKLSKKRSSAASKAAGSGGDNKGQKADSKVGDKPKSKTAGAQSVRKTKSDAKGTVKAGGKTASKAVKATSGTKVEGQSGVCGEEEKKADFAFKRPLNPPSGSSNKPKKKAVDKKNSKGETALHCACRKLELDKAAALLKDGADPNTRDFAGWTPLHEVAQRANHDLVALLLEHDANPNVPGGGDGENVTPLHDAVASGNVDVVRSLIEHGADKKARDSAGKTPREMTSVNEVLQVFDETSCILTASEQLNQSLAGFAASKSETYVIASASDSIKQLEKLKGGVTSLQIEVKSCGFNHNLTHFVTNKVNENNEVADATAGYFEALAVGAWIVNSKWVKASLESGSFQDEVDFEVVGVAKAVHGAPLESRINRAKHLPRLLDGMHVYLHGSFDKPYPNRTELTGILRKGGAVVLKREPDPESIPEKEQRRPYHATSSDEEEDQQEGSSSSSGGVRSLSKCSHFIIYQEGGKSEPMIKYNMDHVKSLPAAWLFECFHNFKLVAPFS